MAVVYGAVGNVSIGGLFLARHRARLHDRHRPDDLLATSSDRSASEDSARRSASSPMPPRASLAAADDPGDHHGRHPDRLVHADRGRHDRLGLYPGGADPAAEPRAHPPAAARLHATPACSTPCRSPPSPAPRRSAGCWATCAAPTSSRRGSPTSPAPTPALIMLLLVLLFVIIGDFVDAGAGDHHLHADHQQADRARQHQSRAYGRGDHHHPGIRPDHAALRPVAAGGLEIRRRAVSRARCSPRCRSMSCSSSPSPSPFCSPTWCCGCPSCCCRSRSGCFKNPSGIGYICPP